MLTLKHYGYLIVIKLCFMTPALGQVNDICLDSKMLITNLLFCDESNIKANKDVNTSCGYNNASVWYSFKPTATDDYLIEVLHSSFNDVVTLYSGSCTSLNEISCTNKDKYGFRGEKLNERLYANTQYYIMVSGADCTFGRTLGKFCIRAKKVVNGTIPTDITGECNQASIISFDGGGNPTSCIVGSNLNATKSDPKPSCSIYAGASTWYKLEAGTSGVLKLEVAPNFSQIVSVYSGNCGNMEEIACSQNGERKGERMLIHLNDPSELYFVQVSGNFNGVAADYSNINLCNQSDFYIDMSLSSNCLTEYIGTPCDDNNASTMNDVINLNCECKGSCLVEGNKCDDGDANTIGDIFDADCDCIGYCGNQGHACNDGDPNTTNDIFDANCICRGSCGGVATTCPLGYFFNTVSCECEAQCIENAPCDDGNVYTGDGVWDEYCNCISSCTTICIHENDNLLYLPNEFCKCECFDYGRLCDDGNEETVNDRLNINCDCKGVIGDYCFESVVVTAKNVKDSYIVAGKYIETDGALGTKVNVSKSLELSAGVEITLNPGFSVNNSAVMHAYILGCDE